MNEHRYRRFFKWSTPDFDGIMGNKVCCSCCGYPTLTAWGGYEICALCWWEDDRTTHKNALLLALFGPNGSYSLEDARLNFEDHGDMFRFDHRRITVVASPSRQRLALLNFVRNLGSDDDLDLDQFLALLSDERQAF